MTKFIFCHHAERADRGLGKKSNKYWGLTCRGVVQTREKAKILAKTVDDAPNGSVVVLGVCSKAIRTKSTLMVLTDELRRIFKDKKDVIFSKPFNPVTPLDSLKEISMKSDDDRAKVIIDFPLHIKEFIASPGQKERTMAKKLLFGLCGAEGFFRRFFPNNPIILVNVGHSREIDALINRLGKENGGAHVSDKTSFYFM